MIVLRLSAIRAIRSLAVVDIKAIGLVVEQHSTRGIIIFIQVCTVESCLPYGYATKDNK